MIYTTLYTFECITAIYNFAASYNISDLVNVLHLDARKYHFSATIIQI